MCKSLFVCKVLFLSCLLFVSCIQSSMYVQIKEYPFSDSRIDIIVDSIYKGMSIEERVAQLYGIRGEKLMENGKISFEKCRELIPNGIGHISQFACMLNMEPDELRDYVKDLQTYLINETPSGIPAIFHEEAITGLAAKGATTYPQQIGMACTWNPELMELKTKYTKETMREVGAFMALSPNVDIIRTPIFNRGEESYGEDAYLTSSMGLAFVKGLQGESLENGVAACAKHYLGYGGGSENNEDNEKVLFEEILMPYDVLLRVGGCKNVMTGYHQFKGTFSVFNKYIIQDILRDHLHFDGIVVSDYGAISTKKLSGNTKKDYMMRVANAINAGCGMEFSEGVCFPYIIDAIEQGLIDEKKVEKAVKDALTLKVRLGLFNKYRKLYKEGKLDFNKKKYCELAYKLASQSVVLLKNNGILPLYSCRNIALVGPNANSPWSMLGDYTYQVMNIFHRGNSIDFESPKIYTLKESLEKRLPDGFNVEYSRGCDWSMDNEIYLNMKSTGDQRFVQSKMNRLKIRLFEEMTEKTDVDDAVSIACRSDVVIAAVGENLTLCGEGRGRKGVRLPGKQEEFVEKLIDTGTPVVLVVFGGRAQVLSEKIMEKCAAIIQAWYPGQEGGNAIADILTGKVNPSGKLSISYTRKDNVEDICYNYGDEYKSFVAFPFGHGLSYNNYVYSDMTAPTVVDLNEHEFKISCNIKNTGNYIGDEVAQLYVSPESDDMPYRSIQLKGFARVSLMPGEEKKVIFTFYPRALDYYNNGNWCLSPGKFIFKIGASSTDIRLSSTVELKGKEIISKNRDIFFSEYNVD